jgi:hypothetical protein
VPVIRYMVRDEFFDGNMRPNFNFCLGSLCESCKHTIMIHSCLKTEISGCCCYFQGGLYVASRLITMTARQLTWTIDVVKNCKQPDLYVHVFITYSSRWLYLLVDPFGQCGAESRLETRERVLRLLTGRSEARSAISQWVIMILA